MVLLAAVFGALVWASFATGTQPYETYEAAVAGNEPVAQFRFDDASGSKTVEDFVGSHTYTATNNGITLGEAGPFGGSKSGAFAKKAYAALPSSPLKEASAFTAEAWVDWKGGSKYNEPVFEFGSSATSVMYLTPASTLSSHEMLFEIVSGTSKAQVVANELTSKSWQYIVVTESAGTLSLYLDGVAVAHTSSVTLTPASLGTTFGNYLGDSVIASEPLFEGSLSNVAFYRTALTPAQISAHYNDAEYPVNVSAPTISGTAKEGSTLTAAPGTWTGLTPAYLYQWLRCNSAGSECREDGKQSATTTYKASYEDIGQTLRVAVTAENSAGSGTATSAQTAAVVPAAPTNTALPTISGTAKEGQLLSLAKGTWEGTPPIAYEYQWQTCNSAGEACINIAGATEASFRITSAQVEKTIRALVTASNVAGSTGAQTKATAKVTTGPPVSVTAPTISGKAVEGQTLTASKGTWAGTQPIETYKYQWEVCNTKSECSNISKATEDSYKLTGAYVTDTIKVKVTAKNSVGSGTATSEPTAPVASPPVNTALPVISGEAKDGKVLEASTGSWTGTPPPEYSYLWKSCNTKGECNEAAGSSYRLEHSDVARTVTVTVTAKNAGGSASATSKATEAIKPSPPQNAALPAITGEARDGEKLEASSGTWAGTPPLEYSYVWKSCNTKGECKEASGSTYQLEHSDVSHTVTVTVTAKNAAGVASATSKATEAVRASPPESTVSPTISGEAKDGQTLSASTGAWTGTPTITYAYKWESCNSKLECSEATGSSYQLGHEDVGRTVTVTVTGENSAGVASATSKATEAVRASPPESTVSPTISGEAKDGQTLSASTGAWTGTPRITYAYQWQRCNSKGESCTTNIPAATSSTYTAGHEDVGATVRVLVTASNAAGSSSHASLPTSDIVAQAPTNTALPSVAGEAKAGQTLTASAGEWAGTPAISYSYQWESCDVLGEGCLPAAGAIATSYALTGEDVGATVRVTVTATNAAGQASAVSAVTAVVAGDAPSNTQAPSLSGTPEEGATLSVEDGTWSGATPITFSYQWQRCEGAGLEAEGSRVGGEGIAVDRHGDIWVSETYRGRLQELNDDGSLLKTVGEPGSGTGQLGEPEGLAIDPSGNIWVADWSNDKIVEFNEAGEWVRDIGSSGSGNGQLSLPYGIAADGEHVWVAEVGNNRLQEFSEDGSYVDQIDGGPSGAGFELSYPVGVALSHGDVLVTDPGNDRVLKLSQTGELLASIASSGSGPGQVQDPGALTVDPAGDIWVLDRGNDRVEEFDEHGEFQRQAPDQAGEESLLGGGTGLALDEAGDVWLTDGSGVAEIAHEAGQYQLRLRCDDIEGSTASTYTATASDVGFDLRAQVTASNAGGEATAYTEITTAVTQAAEPEAPTAIIEPAISGEAHQGNTLTADPGTWSGTPAPTFTYQWQRCNAAGEACEAIPGASSQEYQLVSADVGSTLRVAVTAANRAGSANATSAPTESVEGSGSVEPPTEEAPPSVAGTAVEGEFLTATHGTWAGTGPISYAYQWLSCDEAGAHCAPIASATGASYVPRRADVAATIEVSVTATNTAGSATSDSAPTAAVTVGIVEEGGFGEVGFLSGQMSYPTALAVSPSGELFVLDKGNDRVEQFDQQGEYIAQFGVEGAGKGELDAPTGIAAAANGDIWVAQAEDKRIARFNESGGLIKTLNLDFKPESIAVDGHGDLWIAEGTSPDSAGEPTDQVSVYSEDGAFVRGVGTSGSGPGELREPRSVAAGPEGTMWVADESHLGPQVVEFRENGEPASEWVPRNANGEVTGAVAVALDDEGHVWVADGHGEVYEYSQTGDYLGKSAASSEGPTAEFAFGSGLATAAAGGVWATDPENDRVVRIARDTEAAPTNTIPASIGGVPTELESLHARPGGWTQMPLAYDYQWQRCDASGGSCTNIGGATGSIYVPHEVDLGGTLRLIVTASDPGGSASSTTPATAVVRSGEAAPECTVSWIGPPSGDWSEAGDWSSGHIPTAEDGACIPEGADVEITSGSHPVRRLEDAGALTIHGGTLELSDPEQESNVGDMTLEEGTLTGPGQLTVTHTLSWGAGGVMSGQGKTTIGREATAVLHSRDYYECSTLSIAQRTIVNEGTVRIPGASRPAFVDNRGVELHMSEGARFENDKTFYQNSSCESIAPDPAAKGIEPEFLNRGRFLRTIGSNTYINVYFSNQGQVELTHGAYEFHAGGIPGEVAAGEWRDTAGGENIILFDSRSYPDPAPFLLRQGVRLTEGVGFYTNPIRIPLRGPSAESSSPAKVVGHTATGDTLRVENGEWSGEAPLTYTYQWQLCNGLGGECHNVAGATASTYTIPEGDGGQALRVLITGHNSFGSVTARSLPSGVILAATAPRNETPPVLSGAVTAGSSVRVSTGTWAGSAPLTYSYQWESCNIDAEECSPILGGEASSYEVTLTDVGHALRAVVTATNPGGSASVSVATGAAPIANRVSPEILGTAQAGRRLTALDGAWAGQAPITYSHQWLACDAGGGACQEVEGATGSTFSPSDSLVGETLRVRVTAENDEGTNSATSAATQTVAPAEIVNTVEPSISGTATPGQRLLARTGSWSGPPELAYTYQWQRCGQPDECEAIGGATESEYTVQHDDEADTLQVTVTASGGTASAQATSPQTASVVEMRPIDVTAPSVSGPANVGQTLLAQPGSWSGEMLTFAYQWEECEPSGAACVPLAGETSDEYTVEGGLVGKTVRVIAAATNGLGSSALASAPTAPVRQASTLTNSVSPEITGAPQVGSALESDPGDWSGEGPLHYAYQWQRCDQSNCADIAGAEDPSYVPESADTGKRLDVLVTATDKNGSFSISSPETQPVAAAAAPASASAPTIVGLAEEGETLQAATGEWLSETTPTYTYQWERCDETGANCLAIVGAGASSYTASATDVGELLRVTVTATTAGGSSSASSSATSVVIASFADLLPPTIAPQPGQEPSLSADPGTWSGGAGTTYSYQWRRCDGEGNACSDIAGATSRVLLESAQDTGPVTLRVAVTATHGSRSIKIESAAHAPSTLGPGPWITGGTTVGDTLTAQTIPTKGSPPTYTYAWQRCDSDGNSCLPIAGATEQTYTIQAADLGASLVVVVHSSLEAEGDSQTTSPVWIGMPTLPAGPVTVSHAGESLETGVTLTANVPAVDGSEPISTLFEWQRCNGEGSDCVAIDDASGASYTTDEADLGSTIKLVASFTNLYGTTTSSSPASSAVAHGKPNIVEAPTLMWAGTLEPGRTVSAAHGLWSGDAPINYAYAWSLCDLEGASCNPIEGAQSATYTVAEGDAGYTLEVTVTATNEFGETTATAGGAGDEIHTASGVPANVEPPRIEGAPREEQAIGASAGVWANAPIGTHYSYQWYSCREERPTLEPTLGEYHEGRACTVIEGATAATFTPQSEDVGQALMVQVSAENTTGQTGSAFSAVSSTVLLGPPVNVTLPAIEGEAVAGNTITASAGRWINGKASTADYRWLRCNGAGESCTPIPGATSREYQIPAGASGTLRIAVTVAGEGGQATARSAATATIALGTPPSSSTPPTIEGRAQDGATLTASQGTWSGSAELAYTYAWQRCDSSGGSCVAIAGAEEPSFTLGRADVGHTILLDVTAANGAGQETVSSEATAIVAAAEAPTELIAPALSTSAASVGIGLVLEQGAWSGDVEVGDQWERCDPTNLEPGSAQPTCTQIPNATGPLYAPTVADIGYQLRVTETALNDAGTASAHTAMSAVVAPAVVLEAEPGYSGQLSVGHTVTVTADTTSIPELTSTTEYEFLLTSGESDTVTVQSGPSPSYTPAGSDLGDKLEVRIDTRLFAPSNGETVYEKTTTLDIGTVKRVLSARTVPTISGATVAGAVLEASPGRWEEQSPSTSYAYQWQLCDDTGQSCEPIAPSTKAQLVLSSAMVGHTVRVAVSAQTEHALGTELSEATASVSPASAPRGTSAPVITGTPRAGLTLAATPGTWESEEPIQYHYQWEVCHEPETPCALIAGAEQSHYTLSPAEIGGIVQVQVRATSQAGVTLATSTATEPVDVGVAPTNTAPPTVTVIGPASSEAVLAASSGTWQHLEPAAERSEEEEQTEAPEGLAYQWERCDAGGADCKQITNATGPVYDANVADIGSRDRVAVTGSTSGGELQVLSALGPVITGSNASARNSIAFVEGEQLDLGEPGAETQHTILRCAQLEAVTGESHCVFGHPAISPDGQVVAVEVRPQFAAAVCPGTKICPEQDNSPHAHVVLVNYDGSEARTLPVQAGQPTWEPDDASLLVTRTTSSGGEQDSQLERVDLDEPSAPSAIPLPEGVDSAQSPSVAPDGAQMAFIGRSQATGRWSVYVAEGEDGVRAIPVAFSNVADVDDPTVIGEGENEQVLFSATPTSGQPPRGYESSRARVLYTGATSGGAASPVTEANVDISAPRLEPGGGAVIATRRTPNAQGTGLLAHAWRVPLGSAGTVAGSEALTDTGDAIEASPAAASVTYTTAAQPSAALRAARVVGDASLGGRTGPPLEIAPDDHNLARLFEPEVYVDESDGFLPISETWMLRLSNIGSRGFTRSKLCDPECTKIPLNTPLGPLEGENARIEYPGSQWPEETEATTENTIEEWGFPELWHGLSAGQSEAIIKSSGEAQRSHPHVYYVFTHRHGQLTIDYWYYYTYNYFNEMPKFGENCQSRSDPCPRRILHDLHEGDWENIQVVLNHTELGFREWKALAYVTSRHTKDVVLSPSEIHTRGTHLMVAAAHGDHANYAMCRRNAQGNFEEGVPADASAPYVPGLFEVKDHLCSVKYERPFLEPHAEHNVIAIGGGRTSPLENLASSQNIEMFSCWQGTFGDTDESASFGFLGSLTTKSPVAPLRQLDKELQEHGGRLCPQRQFAS